MTEPCPFRKIIKGEPSGYCQVGDCMFDSSNEIKCGILKKHLEIISKIKR